jgi:hypothetical protein
LEWREFGNCFARINNAIEVTNEARWTHGRIELQMRINKQNVPNQPGFILIPEAAAGSALGPLGAGDEDGLVSLQAGIAINRNKIPNAAKYRAIIQITSGVWTYVK